MSRWFRRRFARLEELRAKYPELDAFLDYLERSERRQNATQVLLMLLSLLLGWLASVLASPGVVARLIHP